MRTKAKTKTKPVKKASRSARNLKRRSEDEDDFRFSQKSLKSGPPIPLSKVLKELGDSVDR